MAHSEDGQYELVLENKQVLGIFFAAAILCGIFFGLGFLVGRSSKGNAPSVIPSASVPDVKAGNKRQSAMTQDKPAEATADAVPDKPVDSRPPADQGAAKGEEKAPPPPAEKPHQEEKKAEEKSAPPPAAAPAAAPAGEGGVVNLQVAAFSTKDEAEPMAALLKRKSFPVSIVPGVSDRLFHVMVGPFANAKAADETKKRLEGEGFKPIIKK